MRTATSYFFNRRGYDGNTAGDIEIRDETEALRIGTLERIAEMKREISLLINEYGDGEDTDGVSLRIADSDIQGDERDSLANSVRIVKLKD